MDTNLPAAPQDELDSPAVAFGHKRDHDLVSNDNDEQHHALVSMPHKRAKLEKADPENGVSSVDYAAAMAPEPVSLGHIDDTRDDAISGEKPNGALCVPRRDLGAAPSMNWNAGTKAKIRTSLGRGLGSGLEKSSPVLPYSGAEKTEKASHYKPLQGDLQHRVFGAPAKSSPTSSETQTAKILSDPPAGEKPVINLPDLLVGELEAARTSSISSGAESEHARSETPSTSLQPTQHSEVGLETDDGVTLLNVQSSGQESGDISEGHVQDSDIDRESDMASNQHRKEAVANSSGSESGDAMILYSESAPTTIDPISKYPAQESTQETRPRTLADLEPEELKLQLRYFHPTKDLDDVDLNGLAKCLVCAQEGHLSDACNKVTCEVCGKRNEHFTRTCPQRTRCRRCRLPGHELSSCRHKPPITRALLICDWCQRVGHIEEHCELLWRTSGRPWESQFIISTFGLGCYECGTAGHLGNDCPSRRPRKPMGTSTWSMPSTHNLTENSSDGMMIKGRAQRKKAQVMGRGDDEDKANFLRPKIPEPARRGQIHIANQSFAQYKPNSWAPDEPRQNNNARGYREPSNLDGRREGYSNFGKQGQYGHRPNDGRSVSPRPSRGLNEKHYGYAPSPQAQHPRHGSSGESYRPMPSAARDAWIKYRK